MPLIVRIAMVALAVLSTLARDGAWGEGRRAREQERRPVPPAADKRDRVVASPASRFNGTAYWQALGQCGGIYFKLSTLYSNAAANAQVVKKDSRDAVAFGKKGEAARRAATAFFDAAERVLIADRKIARDAAVLTYDGAANEAADRLKSVEAGLEAANPCPMLYENCRTALAKICTEQSIPAN